MLQSTEPRWYQDPDDETQLRWWDGQGWTDHVDKSVVPVTGRPVNTPWYRRAWLWVIAALALVLVVTGVVWLGLLRPAVPMTSDNMQMEAPVDPGGGPGAGWPADMMPMTPSIMLYGGSDADAFSSIAQAGNGDIIAVGDTYSSDGDFPTTHGERDAVVARFSPDGVLKWSRTFGGSGATYFTSVVVVPDGSIIVAGATASQDGDFPAHQGGTYDAVVARLTPDGDLQWSYTYGESNEDVFNSVAVAPDGSVIAVGTTNTMAGELADPDGADGVVVRLAPDGNLQWAHTYGGTDSEYFSSVAVAPGGDIIAVGTGESPDGDFPVYTGAHMATALVVRLNPDGALQWFGFDDSSTSHYNSVALAADGGIIAAGDTDGEVARWSPLGDLQWSYAAGGVGFTSMSSVAVAPDASIIVVGRTASPDGDFPTGHADFDALVARLTPDGGLLWSHVFDGTDDDSLDSVAVTPTGTIIAAGRTNSLDGDYPPGQGSYDAMLLILTQE